jgi:hypothetical protein
MVTVFVCSKCGEVVESKFQEVGEIYSHKNCGGKTEVPNESLTNSDVKKIQESLERKKTEETNKLSDKYKILVFIKPILWIFFILQLVGGFLAGIIIPDLPTGTPNSLKFFYGIAWLCGLFGTYCWIIIIDFLFDLDKKTKGD